MNRIFLFLGLILLVTGVLCFLFMGEGTVKVNGKISNDPAMKNLPRYIVGCVVGGLGLIFTLVAIIGQNRSKKQLARNQFILQNGVKTEGTFTFIDKNYAVLMNNKPIYSIVEYIYKDNLGTEHMRRITNFNSDIVIRKKMEVGSKIEVKYLSDKPSESVIVIQ